MSKNTESLAVLADSSSRPEGPRGTTYGGFGCLRGPDLTAVIKADGATDVDFKNVTLNTAAYEALYAKKIDWSAIFDAWGGIEAKQRGSAAHLPDQQHPVRPVTTSVLRSGQADRRRSRAAREGSRALEGYLRPRTRGVGQDPHRRRPGPREATELVNASAEYLAPIYVGDSSQWGEFKEESFSGLGAILAEAGALKDASGKAVTLTDYSRFYTNDLLPSHRTRIAWRVRPEPGAPRPWPTPRRANARQDHHHRWRRRDDDDADTIIFGGAVVLEGDRIVAVGEAVIARATGGIRGRVIDATGKAVLPGLVDLHYHTALARASTTCRSGSTSRAAGTRSSARSTTRPRTGPRWPATRVDPVRRDDSQRRTGASSRWPTRRGDRHPRRASNDVADDEHDLDTLDDNARAFEAKNGAANGRIQVRVGIEWLPLSSRELLVGARELADALGTGIHIHLNESLSEVEISKTKLGGRPTEVAYECGILGPDCIAAHCVWLSDVEIALIARDRHPDLAQPQLQREARQRHHAPARDAGGRPQHRPRPRRGGVQQQPRHVRGHEVPR
jgi:hypothetical protein